MDNFETIGSTMFNLIRNFYYLDLGQERAKVKSKYSDWNLMSNFIFEGNCDFFPYLSPCPKYSLSKLCMTMTLTHGMGQGHDHDLDPWNGSRSNANILIEIHCMTLFDGYCNDCHIGHHFQAKFCQNVHDLDKDLKNGPRSNFNTSIENPYIISYWIAIVIVDWYFTISKIYAFGICTTLTLSYRIGQGQMKICQSKGHTWLAIWWQ